MRAAQASIEIAAPIERIWSVMLDVSRYGEWNPFIVRVDAKEAPRLDGELTLHVKWAKGGGASSRERITRLDAPSSGRAAFEYVFLGPLAAIGAVKATRVQSLEQLDDTRCLYRTREEFGGWLQWALPLAAVQAGFDAHAQALKRQAEFEGHSP